MSGSKNVPPPAASVVPFRRSVAAYEGEQELSVGLPPALASMRPSPAPAAVVAPELAGRAKVWFVSGPGRSGKTTLLRYVMETMTASGSIALAAALDPQNRSLAGFLDGVEQPPTNDAAAVARWLESLLKTMMEEKGSALLDLGGGDTSLGRVLSAVPDLADVMESAGVAPVAIYTLGPRVDDLASLASFEARGFQPRATAIVLNEGLADPTTPRDEAFGRVLRHSAFKAAVERGAVVLWMPRLEPAVAAEIEAKRLHFTAARDGQSPKSRSSVPLGPFDRSRVRAWMLAMDAMLAPVQPWLP